MGSDRVALSGEVLTTAKLPSSTSATSRAKLEAPLASDHIEGALLEMRPSSAINGVAISPHTNSEVRDEFAANREMIEQLVPGGDPFTTLEGRRWRKDLAGEIYYNAHETHSEVYCSLASCNTVVHTTRGEFVAVEIKNLGVRADGVFYVDQEKNVYNWNGGMVPRNNDGTYRVINSEGSTGVSILRRSNGEYTFAIFGDSGSAVGWASGGYGRESPVLSRMRVGAGLHEKVSTNGVTQYYVAGEESPQLFGELATSSDGKAKWPF